MAAYDELNQDIENKIEAVKDVIQKYQVGISGAQLPRYYIFGPPPIMGACE